MHADGSIPDRDRNPEHEAAEWLARRDRGMTPNEQDEFCDWLGENPQHGEWLARQQQTLRRLEVLAQWRPEHGARPNPDLLAARPPRRRWILPAFIAAAAALVLLLTSWAWRASSRDAATSTPLTSNLLPIEMKVLEDNSVIELNHGAAVVVDFTEMERRVRLTRGEAHFTVAKNHPRPFIVQVGTVQLRAVGTAFNVNFRAAAVDVLVTEGKVAIDRPAPPKAAGRYRDGLESASRTDPVLEAGQRVLVPLALDQGIPVPLQLTSGEIARLLAWQPRRLEFSDIPLSQIVAEFNRDNRIKMVVDDPELGQLLIGATLRSDNVEGFVRLLEASFDVQVERRANGVIVLRRQAASETER